LLMSKQGPALTAASPASFGIGNILAPNTRIYYDNLFSTQYLGRVSDLLAAQLRTQGLDELRFRAVLLFAVFEGYRSQTDGEVLAQPLVLECGVDAEKVVIGISFRRAQEKGKLAIEGLSERLVSKHPGGPFEVLLGELHAQSDRLVIRIEPDTGRFEAVAILSLSGAAGEKAAPEVQLIGSAEPGERTSDSYTQLADLDYQALLKAPSAIKVKAQSPLGELIARVAKGQTESTENIRVAGPAYAEFDESRNVVTGVTDHIGSDESHTISGSGDSAVPGGENERFRSYQEKIAELEQQLSEKSRNERPSVMNPSALTGLLKKAWPFRRAKVQVDETPREEKFTIIEPPPIFEADLASEAQSASSAQATTATATDAATGPDESPSETAGKLVREIHSGGFNQAVTRVQQKAAEIREELSSERAQGWMDGMLGELVAEKSRLHDLAKQVNLSVRRKEHHFKSREQALQEELRRKDEALRQKDVSLGRLRDQLSEVNMTLERSKTITKTTSDTGQFKHKYMLSQRMLVSAKEENSLLKSKVDDLRSQLLSAQSASKLGSAPLAELSALRMKHERTNRQLEDLRQQHKQISDKLAEVKKDRSISGGNVEDLKRRLDAATKLAISNSKEAEQLKLQVEELKREEGRLKMELQRGQQELRDKKIA